ncbi:MAG: PHP domain-containing protein [Deltaproteobacteria bacterium]|nr:PHP domain-containing protein [Deltaproteobacteria bacterium]MBW1962108.1 PHP domain-containing protein [Deltaproteobacteria bacterium]MBW2153915.1 PHP domain-containing protein [Deltaproteobacteria bacterium]
MCFIQLRDKGGGFLPFPNGNNSRRKERHTPQTMLQVDLHSHTLFSCCGIHTALEMLHHAKALGLNSLAITDHGLALQGRLNGNFFKRFINPVPGIRLLKGVECNLLDAPGRIDCPLEFLPYMDVVLLGLHNNIKKGLGKKRYTDMMLEALDSNPYVDIIAHPDVAGWEVAFEPVVRAAVEHGMAIELNNSKSALGGASPEETRKLILTCKRLQCPVVISSDAHAVNEIGQDRAIRVLLEELEFPEDLVINRDVSTAMAFIEQRRERKRPHRGDILTNPPAAAS